MRTRRVVAITGALAGLIAAALTGGVTSAQGPALPKTPWGDPDLQGTFSSEAELSVPFERQAQYGERRFLTDAEYVQRRTQADKQLASDSADFDLETADRSNAQGGRERRTVGDHGVVLTAFATRINVAGCQFRQELFRELADLVDRDRLAILGTTQPVQVRMRPCPGKGAFRAYVAGLQPRSATGAEERRRQRGGKPLLADSGGALQQERVRQATALDRRLQPLPRRRMPGRHLDSAPGLILGFAHVNSGASAERTAASTSSIVPAASMTRTRPGSRRARSR